MMKIKTTDDMEKINTLLANCNRNLGGFEMQNYEF